MFKQDSGYNEEKSQWCGGNDGGAGMDGWNPGGGQDLRCWHIPQPIPLPGLDPPM